jgi:hypothetical protein
MRWRQVMLPIRQIMKIRIVLVICHDLWLNHAIFGVQVLPAKNRWKQSELA